METLSCTLRSRGYELDPEHFGTLTDSSAHLEDMPRLRQAMVDDGYIFLKGFWDREEVLAARKVVTDRLLEAGMLDPDYPSELGKLADVKIVNDRSAVAPDLNGNTVPVKKFSADDLTITNQPLQDMLAKGRIIDFFSNFLGGPARRFNYVWFRAIGTGPGSCPHCDWVYMGRGTTNLYTTWVALGDTPLDVGGLIVLENSHKQADRLKNYLSRDVDVHCTTSPNAAKLESGEMLFEWNGTLTKNPRSLREKLGGRWLTAEYEPGDLLIFGMQTIHGSLDNQTDRIRISADTRYQLASDPIDERFAAEHPAPYHPNFKRGRVC